MKAALALLAFALIGCDAGIHGMPQTPPADPNAPPPDPANPAAETRPDLSIVVHASVSDSKATDSIVQLSWDVTFTGPPQSITGLTISVIKDGAPFSSEAFVTSQFTVPSTYNGPSNPLHLTNVIRMPVGIYTFEATVDSAHAISESNEFNNTSAITVEVMPNGAG